MSPPLPRTGQRAGAALAVVLFACVLAIAPAAAEPVPTMVLARQAAAASFELDGVAEALHQGVVAAQAGGSLLAVDVRAGDTVRRGQTLARIDARETSAALLGADAAVAQADALRVQALAAAERARELHRTGFISAAARDQADAQWRAADAALAASRAAQAQAALARGFTTVTAPFAGVVLATHAEPGELARPGSPLLTLYAPGALRAVVQVPGTRAGLTRAATRTEVRLPDGRWVSPLRRTELPGADPVAQTVEWRLDLDPADTPALRPGQTLRVRFTAEAAPVAATSARAIVPAAAVLRRGELSAVYVATEGRFVLRAVRLGAGLASGDVELLAGVREGESIALDAVRAGLADAIPAAR